MIVRPGFAGFRSPSSALFGGGPPLGLSTAALCHFDGSDQATTTADVIAGVSHTFSLSWLDTSKKKFGTASLQDNGTAGTPTNRNSINGVVLSGEADWTMEGFMFHGSGGVVRLVYIGEGASPSTYLQGNTNNGRLEYVINNGTDLFISSWANTGGISPVVWYHYAMERHGTNYNLYWNGTRLAQHVDAKNLTPPTLFQIQTQNSVANTAHFDELRISQVARYESAATYTVPSAPFVSDN